MENAQHSSDAATAPALALTPRRRGSPAIATAFAASLAIHVAIGASLIGLASTDHMARDDDYVQLSVRLVDKPWSPAPLPAPAAMDTIVSQQPEFTALRVASIEVAPAPPPAVPSAGSAATDPLIPVEARPESAAPVPAAGTIAIAEPLEGMAALSPDLAGRSQSDYLIEVEKPVRVLRMPAVVYPPTALDARREGTVLLWLAIDREGAIEDVVFDYGEPEFVDAVTAALPSAKFLPAEERGEIIPFYIVLRFDFRTAGATTTAAGAVEAGK